MQAPWKNGFFYALPGIEKYKLRKGGIFLYAKKAKETKSEQAWA